MASRMDFFPRRHFTLGWKIAGNLINLLPTFIVLGAFGTGLAVSALTNSFPPAAIGTMTALIVYVLYMFFFPFMAGNFLIPAKLPDKGEGHIVQITFTPRLRPGLEGVIDDADEFGVVTVEGDYLIFKGSSVYLAIQRSDIGRVSTENVGFYAMFILGSSPVVDLRVPLGGFNRFKLTTREGNTLLASRRKGRELIALFERTGLLPPPLPTR